jgi:hypothetical protein
MLLEAQLSQLAAAISSQETLISTLQSNEAEARNMGALYLVGGAELDPGAFCLLVHMPCLTACYCPNSSAWRKRHCGACSCDAGHNCDILSL